MGKKSSILRNIQKIRILCRMKSIIISHTWEKDTNKATNRCSYVEFYHVFRRITYSFVFELKIIIWYDKLILIT